MGYEQTSHGLGADAREEVALRRWLNLLGLPGVYVRNLFGGELADGLVILKAMDKVEPGIVYWKRVNMKTPIKIKFKRMENCNYVVTLGKQMKMNLVNIGGKDATALLACFLHLCLSAHSLASLPPTIIRH